MVALSDRAAQLERRWTELHRQLQDLLDGKVIQGDNHLLDYLSITAYGVMIFP